MIGFLLWKEMMQKPIGFFDSGIGGLSIWKEIIRELPFESTCYLADTINVPYGEKTSEQIVELCFKNVIFLLEKKCKIIVVACNTATTNAIEFLRKKYSHIPFIGIEPAIKPAAISSKTKSIGLLATKGTLQSNLFAKTFDTYFKNIEVVVQHGAGIVELIERGLLESPQMKKLLQKYINPMLKKNIDYLVLGCSHYSFLAQQIRQMTQNRIQIIDSAKPVAKRTQYILQKNRLLNEKKLGQHQIITNGDLEILKKYCKKLDISAKICKASF